MTVSAEAIDAALDAEQSPRAIARFFGIPVSQVMSRARLKLSPFEVERRRLEAVELRRRQEAREKSQTARAMAAAEADALARRDEYTEWVALPIAYEDEPRSRPFDYSRAFANTVKYQKRSSPHCTLGGVACYEGREAA